MAENGEKFKKKTFENLNTSDPKGLSGKHVFDNTCNNNLIS